jgi:hypothetical protein
MRQGVFETRHKHVGYGGFPYVPLLKCPYYVYVGKKTSDVWPASQPESVNAQS